MLIEWNAHMFSRDQARYPFHPQAAYVPREAMLAADPLGDYLARMAAEGIDRAVLVQPEPYGDDHALVLDCLSREPERLRGTAFFYPKDPGAPQKLVALGWREPRIVAMRFHAHRGKEHYLDSFTDAGVRALWHRAADLGLIIELHIGPSYAADVAAALRLYPRIPVLIDHLAEPKLGTPEEFEDVLALAAFDNVYMKLSGLGHFAKDAPRYEDALPLTRRVIDAFGPDRLVWGDGSPTIVDTHLAHLPEVERAKVKGGNLARLLKFV
jgi:predicted TIM-barrel fold metal-dependent hydrolase